MSGEEEVPASQMVIDAGTGRVSGRDQSFQAQETVRKAVDLAQAGGTVTEEAALKELDKKLRELRTETSLQARTADQDFMKNLEARSKAVVPQKKKHWWQ